MKMDPSGSDMSFAKLNETTCELCNGVGVAKDCWVLLSSFKLLCGWLLSLYRRVDFFCVSKLRKLCGLRNILKLRAT